MLELGKFLIDPNTITGINTRHVTRDKDTNGYCVDIIIWLSEEPHNIVLSHELLEAEYTEKVRFGFLVDKQLKKYSWNEAMAHPKLHKENLKKYLDTLDILKIATGKNKQ